MIKPVCSTSERTKRVLFVKGVSYTVERNRTKGYPGLCNRLCMARAEYFLTARKQGLDRTWPVTLCKRHFRQLEQGELI